MKIQLKRSNVLNGGQAKEPTASQMEYGELAVNYNEVDPTIFIKDSTDQIVALHLNDAGSAVSGPTPPTNGNQIGDLFFDTTLNVLLVWDGSEWVEVGPTPAVIIQPTPPATAGLEAGALWWNSDASDLNLYILYNDPDPDAGLKWIEISGSGDAIDANDYVKLDDGGTKQVIESRGLGLSDGITEKTTFDHFGGASFADGKFKITGGTGQFECQPDNSVGKISVTYSGGVDNTLKLYSNDKDGNREWELAADGTASFAGGDFTVDQDGRLDAYVGNFDILAVEPTNRVATNTGVFTQPSDAGTSDRCISLKHNGDGYLLQGGDSTFTTADNAKVSISASGAANFAGGNIMLASDGGANFAGGDIVLASDGGAIFGGTNTILYSDGGATFASNKVVISNAGAATFAGEVQCGTSAAAGKAGVVVYGNSSAADSAACYARQVNPSGKTFCGTQNDGTVTASIFGNGNAVFSGTVTPSNVTFNLEPDNPDNYTTTMVDGEEQQVYNGPTLDVKERITNLVSRLDAIEANEIIDDATDTSLLQLLANASARLDSIESRLAALEESGDS